MLISLFTLRNKWLPGFVRPIDLHFVYFSSFVLVRLVEDVSSFSFLSDPETRWTDKEVHFSPQSPHHPPRQGRKAGIDSCGPGVDLTREGSSRAGLWRAGGGFSGLAGRRGIDHFHRFVL